MQSILSKTIGTLMVATAVVAAPAVASAAPVAGCGSGWNLLTIEQANGSIDWRIYSPEERADIEIVVAGLDQNLDGYLCVKQYKPNQGQDKHWGAPDYIITATLDNHAQGRVW